MYGLNVKWLNVNPGCFQYRPEKRHYIWPFIEKSHLRPENQTYLWARLGCGNYAPTFFGTSLPEVVDIKENEDGTVTLTVEAVCDMVICDDAVITHELTVRFAEDGSFQYLGNEILNDGIMHIPDYQYRIRE